MYIYINYNISKTKRDLKAGKSWISHGKISGFAGRGDVEDMLVSWTPGIIFIYLSIYLFVWRTGHSFLPMRFFGVSKLSIERTIV